MILLILFNYIASSFAEIISSSYNAVEPLKPAYFSIPKYSPEDAPHSPPGRGHSFIDLSDLTLELDCDSLDDSADDYVAKIEMCANTTVDIMIFEAPSGSKRWLDYFPAEGLCCTTEMLELELCRTTEHNQLILPGDLPGVLKASVTLSGPDETYSMRQLSIVHHSIEKTGMYIVLFGVCSPFTAPVLVSGSIDSMDPYGYLPADLYGDMPFYLTLSLAYTVAGAGWLFLCYRHMNELINVQYWITIILALGMLESLFLYDHFLCWNDYGTADAAKSLELFGIFLGVLKRGISRVFVLMVAMGYGTVKPSLGEDTQRILWLGGAYILLALCYDLTNTVSNTSHVVAPEDSGFMSIVVVGLAAADSVFYIWTFSSINELIVVLRARKQNLKARLYTNFLSVLYCSCFISLGWLLYSSFFILNDYDDSNWSLKWAVDAIYEVIYFAVFMAMAFLWAPTRNSQRYAYSIELSSKSGRDSDSDEENSDSEDSSYYAQQRLASNGTTSVKRLHSEGSSPTRRNVDLSNVGDERMDAEYGGTLRDSDEPSLLRPEEDKNALKESEA